MVSAARAKNIDLAVELLKTAAANDPGAAADIQQKLGEAGFTFPASLAASAQSLRGIAIGDFDPARGVYLGTVEAGPGHVVHAYAAEDFLRDEKGRQLVLTFNEAVKELSKRNNGRSYGNGTDRAMRQAITGGTYQDGDLVLPSKDLLHGRDVSGNTTRPEQNLYALLKADKLPKIAAAIATGKGDQHWAVSGSVRPGRPSLVYHVRLPDGVNGWNYKDCDRSGVVPVRCFRSLSQAPAPMPGG